MKIPHVITNKCGSKINLTICTDVRKEAMKGVFVVNKKDVKQQVVINSTN